MKKGFTLVEVIVGMIFVSLILLTSITIILNIHKSIDNMSSNSIVYEKIKYIDNLIENQINNRNGNIFYLRNNHLYCDNDLIINYEDKSIIIYNDNTQLFQEEVDFFNINVVNPKLLKIDFSINAIKIERYYYIGGKIIET